MLSNLIAVLALMGAGDPDQVISTAPRTDVRAALIAADVPTPDSPAAAVQAQTPHGLSTDEQIDRWIEARAPETQPFAAVDPGPVDDRQVHGMVSAGIGTEGYSTYGAAVSLPIGESGRLDMFYSQTKNGLYPYDYGYGGREYGAPFDASSGFGLRATGRERVSEQSFGASIDRRDDERD